MANTKQETIETMQAETPDLNEYRWNSKITIMLPLPQNTSETIDNYEFPTVNGKTYQIKCGEPVDVPWPVFEVLMETGRYDPKQIVI